MTDLFNPTPEHHTLRQTLRRFAETEVEAQAAAHDREERFNLPLFRQLGELGLLGLTAPVEHGGAGMDAAAVALAHEELSAVDPGFTLAYLAHALLFVNNLAINGSEAQCAKYLPDACSGAKVGGMCMSEPGAGTDVLGMSTRAVRRGDTYVLNGAKMWITNGAISDTELGDVFLVYARVEGAPRGIILHRRVDKGEESSVQSRASRAMKRRLNSFSALDDMFEL